MSSSADLAGFLGEPVPFKLPRFYPILDTATLDRHGCRMTVAADALLEAGVRVLQYRHKLDWTQHQFDEARALAGRCQEAGVLFVLNDRADFARLFRCALHVGQGDLPPAAARRVIGDEVMGLSTHGAEQLLAGDREPVEYLSLGPIFSTHSKDRPDPVVGLQELARARKLTAKPLVAIGGIGLANAQAVLDSGADSLAIISAVLPSGPDKKSIRKRANEWLALLA